MPIDAAVNAVEQDELAGIEIVKMILERGASPNKFGSGYGSPLERAKKRKNQTLVSLLQKYGAKD